ncbi:MAG TPA: HD domain-containing protein [Thermoanaerobaculaceae bacterium]|nr:HD domain-containing protein [Thermoanaerobaculaceae bacterium]HRS14895.1 HD domain-containing protein [Thermoanaerobaculaceae bacterium]
MGLARTLIGLAFGRVLMPDLGERFERALVLAARLHRRQNRKGTSVPYVAHLLGVCATVLEHGGGEDEAIAALLHDAVEDQGGAATFELIRSGFGEKVAALVAACTDAWTVPKPPWKQRKQAYLERLAGESDGALLVGAADKLYNLRSVVEAYRVHGEAVWSRFSRGREEQVWYFESVVAVLRGSGRLPPALAAELERELAELRALLGV